MAKTKRQNKPKTPEPFFQDMVSIYFSFCKDKFHEVPTFDGSAPRDLKSIIKTLRQRAESIPIEWDYETATTRFRHFLEFAYSWSQWLRNNWLLFNLNRQKDAIFYAIKQQSK